MMLFVTLLAKLPMLFLGRQIDLVEFVRLFRILFLAEHQRSVLGFRALRRGGPIGPGE